MKKIINKEIQFVFGQTCVEIDPTLVCLSHMPLKSLHSKYFNYMLNSRKMTRHNWFSLCVREQMNRYMFADMLVCNNFNLR